MKKVIGKIKSSIQNRRNYRDIEQNLWRKKSDGSLWDLKDMNIVILTGAGVSRDSGIRTFRDEDGLWENHKVEEVCRPEGLINNPELLYKFYAERREKINRDIVSREEWDNALERKERTFKALWDMGLLEYKGLYEGLRDIRNNKRMEKAKDLFKLKEGEDVRDIEVPKTLADREFEKFKYRALKGHGDMDALWIMPNSAHYGIQALVTYLRAKGAIVDIVTQNVDELHEHAGSREVYHIHGLLNMNVCSRCKSTEYMSEVSFLVNQAHMLISTGTSGNVYPAAGFAQTVKRNGGMTVSVNPDVVSNEWMFDYILSQGSYEGVGLILDSLKRKFGDIEVNVDDAFLEAALNGLVDASNFRKV